MVQGPRIDVTETVRNLSVLLQLFGYFMNFTSSRRRFIDTGVLSVTAIGMLAGTSTAVCAQTMDTSKDIGILNVALGLEHEAISAYQLGAQSNLLQKGVLDVAVLFQSHHKAHRDALVATIEKMGGKAVAEKSLNDYAKALGADGLKNQTDVLMLAAKLELGAINAYLGVIPAFKDSKLAQIAGRLAADETMHWTALKGALSQALPNGALSFGG
jgi:Ferritin-like domain